MAKFVGSTGLTYLWNKIKSYAKITTSDNVATITIGGSSVTPITSHQDISGKVDKSSQSIVESTKNYGTPGSKKNGVTVTIGTSSGASNATVVTTDLVADTIPTNNDIYNHIPSCKAVQDAIDVLEGNVVAYSDVGAASGVCPLNASTKIDSQYLPSYVDDVIEAYIRANQTPLSSTWLATGSASGTVITPETGKIYVLMNSDSTYAENTQFRWGGTAYVQLYDGGAEEMTTAEMDTATNNWS